MTTREQKRQDEYLQQLMGALAVPGYHSSAKPDISCGCALGCKKDEKVIPVSKMRGGRE